MTTQRANNLFQTNNYSIVSKYSAVKSGYFKDHILQELIENTLKIESWRRTPLVNRGYAARLLAMDWVVDRAILFDHIDCFIVLGAGYDTLPFRKANRSCNWIEIDLPQVVEIKSKFIAEKRILGDCDELKLIEDGLYSSSNYNLMSCDLKQTEKLATGLKKALSMIGKRRNVAIINEVCFCYLELQEILNIMAVVIKAAEDLAFRIHYIGYEQVEPVNFSPLSEIMLDHFSALGYPLKHYPTHQELENLFCKSLSFQHITISNMFQIYHNALMDKRVEIEASQNEPFDEFEEMDLYLGHYALVTGVLILKDPFLPLHNPHHQADDKQLPKSGGSGDLCEKLKATSINSNGSSRFLKSSLKRYGHSSCLLSDSSILISGGFGATKSNLSSQHKRLHDCILMKKVKEEFISFQSCSLEFDVPESTISLGRMHGRIAEVSQNLLFFNGGRQSPTNQKPNNVNFITSLHDNTLHVKHKFNFEQTEPPLRWRQGLTPVSDNLCWQIGGLSTGIKQDSSHFLWEFSSDKLGFLPCHYVRALDRHSFGLDRKDRNVVLIYGGLETNPLLQDQPVEKGLSVVLWDTRCDSKPNEVQLKDHEPSYGARVHFIDDNCFIRLGGVSTRTGLIFNGIDLVDLRNNSSYLLTDNLINNTSLEVPLVLSSLSTCHLKEDRTIVTFGGGGNFFTFGTYFNQHHLFFDYNQKLDN